MKLLRCDDETCEYEDLEADGGIKGIAVRVTPIQKKEKHVTISSTAVDVRSENHNEEDREAEVGGAAEKHPRHKEAQRSSRYHRFFFFSFAMALVTRSYVPAAATVQSPLQCQPQVLTVLFISVSLIGSSANAMFEELVVWLYNDKKMNVVRAQFTPRHSAWTSLLLHGRLISAVYVHRPRVVHSTRSDSGAVGSCTEREVPFPANLVSLFVYSCLQLITS
jgi:hypothetical protein